MEANHARDGDIAVLAVPSIRSASARTNTGVAIRCAGIDVREGVRGEDGGCAVGIGASKRIEKWISVEKQDARAYREKTVAVTYVLLGEA